MTVVDLRDQDRWTEYCRTAIDRGIHSVAGIPMPIEERRIGALDLYRREPHHWGEEELHIAQLLADMASGYVLNAAELSESRTMASVHDVAHRVVHEDFDVPD